MTRLFPCLLIAWLACAQVPFSVYAGVAAGLAVTSVLAYKKARLRSNADEPKDG